MVLGQDSGSCGSGTNYALNGDNGRGGLLMIHCPHYLASPIHWNLDSQKYGVHDPSIQNGGHGIITGNPQKVFINNWEYSETGYKAEGSVKTGDNSHAPIPGVNMTFSIVSGTGNLPVSVTTDANGEWSQTGFQIGTTYKVSAEKNGYTFSPSDITLSVPNTKIDLLGNADGAFSGSGMVTTAGISQIAIPGVVMTFSKVSETGVLPTTVTTDSNGYWSQLGFQVGAVYTPAIGADGTIYIGSYDKKLYAINPDGSEKWEFLTKNWITSSPAIGTDGTVRYMLLQISYMPSTLTVSKSGNVRLVLLFHPLQP